MIVLCVCNTSEACMWMESYNQVYGRTNNPYDLARTPGGSSGGVSALVSACASPLGLTSGENWKIKKLSHLMCDVSVFNLVP